MRILILKDEIIKDSGYKKVVKEVSDIFKDYAGITPEVTTALYDHSDPEGAVRHTFDSLPYGYMKEHIDNIHQVDAGRYDHIIFLVHRNNWVPTKKIWGENFSNFFYDYHVQVCRYDHRNLANSVGTMWHEIHHAIDAIIETELGIKIEPLIGVNSWDADITHGGRDSGGSQVWSYIRHKENRESLTYIAPLLKRAYTARKDRYLKNKIALLQRVIQLVKEVIRLKRVLTIKHTSKCQKQS